jgi:ArsR family transcriptional regulator, arsenate/arsenite/antimonite-responsive transcriptional repressor
MDVDRRDAAVYATWFACLGDPTRILILNLLARAGAPRTVGQIVEALDVGQSTVSHHLQRLAACGFVRVERRGTTSLYRVNEACVFAKVKLSSIRSATMAPTIREPMTSQFGVGTPAMSATTNAPAAPRATHAAM